MSLLGLCLASLVSAPCAEPVMAARALEVDPVELAAALADGLSEGARFPSNAAVAVVAEAPPGWENVADAVGRALAYRLSALGELTPLSGAPDPTRAVAEGFEWWISVRLQPDVDALRASAELEEIDAGLWTRSPALVAAAHARLAFAALEPPEGPPVPVVPEPPTVDPPRELGLGAPISLERWPRPVWALALCPVAVGRDLLVVLDPVRLSVLDLHGRALRVVATREVEHREGPARPVRAPFAAVRCGPDGRAAAGSGRWREGFELRLEGELEPERRFPGLPVGYVGTDVQSAAPFEGTRSLEPELRGSDGPLLRLESRPLEAVRLADGSTFVIDALSELRPVTASGAFGASWGRVGVGASARSFGGRTLVATTAVDPDAEHLELFEGGRHVRRALSAPARATSLGYPRGRRPAAVVSLDDGTGSRLVLVPIQGVP